jgi:hypothetical protein
VIASHLSIVPQDVTVKDLTRLTYLTNLTMVDDPMPDLALIAGLRAVIEAKDTENALLRAELEAQLERYRRLELRVAELERQLGSDSANSGIPPSKDPIGARERRKAERQSSERDRRKDRKRGGQPGHPGAGLLRDPDPDERTEVPPPAECSRCGTGLEGAERAGTWWSQVWDVKIARFVTEYLLPLLTCSCCGKVNAARGPGQSCPGSVSYGPGINTAAVLLSSYGNVPSERVANLIGMLLGMPVSAGFVDLASERLSAGSKRPGSMTRCRPPWEKSQCWPPMRLRSISWIRTPGWQKRTRARRTCWWSAPRIAG